MVGSELSALVGIREQVAEIDIRLSDLVEGNDDFLLTAAQNRLGIAARAVPQAAGGLSSWPRTVIPMVPYALCCWGTASAAGGLGLSGGWIVTVTLLVAAFLVWPSYVLNNALSDRLNQRRTSRPSTAGPPMAVQPVGPERERVTELLRLVDTTRDGLREAVRQRTATHRLTALAGSAAGFSWLATHDRRLWWYSRADRCLAQVSVLIAGWWQDREEAR